MQAQVFIVFANTRTNILGNIIKRVNRPLRKGESPVVTDTIPPEKSVMSSALTDNIIDSVLKEIDLPPLPPPSFTQRLSSHSSALSFSNTEIDRKLKTLRENRNIRIEEVNLCLEQLCFQNQNDKALSLINNLRKDYGLAPDAKTESIVAEIALKKAQPQDALAILDAKDELTEREELVYGELVMRAIKNDLKQGLELYERYAVKAVCVSPLVVSSVIVACARRDFVERGFRVYREAKEARHMLPNILTQSALLFAAAQRKEYYREAVELFRQMIDRKMPPSEYDYGNLLKATSKVGDMKTALAIWDRCQSLGIQNSHHATSVLYALAASETGEAQLSLRQYANDIDEQSIVGVAKEIFGGLKDANEQVASAYLACMAAHKEKMEAERIYYDVLLPKKGYFLPANTENLIRLYDTLHDLPSMEQVLSSVRTGVSLTRLTYRAIIRTYAFNLNYPKAMEWLEKMNIANYRPTVKELELLYKGLCFNELEGMKTKFHKLVVPNEQTSSNAYLPWRLRSVKIAGMMKNAYGPNAPKNATTYI